MELVQQLEQELEAFKREYEKFEKGNKSAGTRARKVLQDIKRTCQDLRVSIQGVKKESEGRNLKKKVTHPNIRNSGVDSPFKTRFFSKIYH